LNSSNALLRHATVMLERAGKEQKSPLWREAFRILSAPASIKVEVNVRRLSRIAHDEQAVFVPGKVLGSGVMEKKVVVGAFSFSGGAKSKIEAAGGKALTVEQFLKRYPKGNGVKLVR
jgi:large subunit ribosomal protein L18e